MTRSFRVAGMNERAALRMMCLRMRVEDRKDLWMSGCLEALLTVMHVRLSVRSISTYSFSTLYF